jgi:cytosine/creatinine deaminase
MSDLDRLYLHAAIRQGFKSYREGGIPIGASLAVRGVLVGLGHNRRKQRASQILHAEMDCLENAGRLARHDFDEATIYSTLMPCYMCSGTIVQFGIRRVVIADDTFTDAREFLQHQGVELIVAPPADDLPLAEIRTALAEFQRRDPETWAEDIGRHWPS